MKKTTKLLISLFICTLLILPITKSNNVKIIETNVNDNILSLNKSSSSKNVNNIAVFIEFEDSKTTGTLHLDDEQSVENAYKIFNSDDLLEMDSVNGIIQVPSFKKYFERESYGKLLITTEIFPKIAGKVVSYKAPNKIGYYLSYSDANTIGYKDKTEGNKREKELIEGAIEYIKSQVETEFTANELDADGNGDIDSITFLVEASHTNLQPAWGDLLWSHESSNTGISKNISGKNINAYTIIYTRDYTDASGTFSFNRGGYGTMIHEYGHVLGYRDLYRYGTPSAKPVGFFDVMGNVIGSNPQSFLTYFTSEFSPNMNWHNKVPVITKTTENITLYKPEFKDPNEQRAIKIDLGSNNKEFFMIEYYDRLNTYNESRADSSGIIIYRVNENNKYNGNGDGSNQGKNEHVYIFRPGETGLGDSAGDLKQATLNMSRKTYGVELDLNNTSFDSKTIYFSDGTNSGITIEVTSETNNSVTFNVKFPEFDGDGTASNPYLIKDTTSYLYHMSNNTTNKYYKLTSDLDFTNIIYPVINFEGNLDGNNKIIKNITTNGSGIFNFIGNYEKETKIENLIVENLTVYSNKGDYLGGLASVAENIIINNVHLKSGTVTNDGQMKHGLASTGGFLGNVYNNVTITNSSTKLNVKAEKNVGGFIGINQNATIKNSFASNTVTGNTVTGGFIGVQSVSDNVYKIPQNVYFNATDNNTLLGVGGYSRFHNTSALDESSLSKGIISVKISKTLEIFVNSKTNIEIITNPITNLTYSVTTEKPDIIKYENDKLVGLQKGTSKIYININVGTSTMELTADITVKEFNGTMTEEELINYLGLTKKGDYLVGFKLGDNIDNIKNEISSINGVTFKNFTDAQNNEISDTIIGTGMKFTIIIDGIEYTYTVIIKGDVNGDGLIYATDYVKVKNHIMGKSKLTDAYLMAADINNDGKIYATDYVQIKNHIMGKTPITQN